MRLLLRRGPAAAVLLLAALASARTTESGLEIEDVGNVSCARKSRARDVISVHYKGTLADGTVFDSSYDRQEPMQFELGIGRVIKGFDEGLLGMCIGQQRKLTIPPSLAYGDEKVGTIPPGSTLIFETKLVGIEGVQDDAASSSAPATTSTSTSSTSPPQPTSASASSQSTWQISSAIAFSSPSPSPSPSPRPQAPVPAPDPDTTPSQPPRPPAGAEDGECRLLGPFALVVQAGLGLLALGSLVWKRWRERPRRPLKVWFFDASKQVVGSVLLHVLNLVMSILSVGEIELAHKAKQASAALEDAGGRGPNPCSLYLINLAIDTTIGIPILVVLLKVLHAAARLTPLARPPESIKSGHYGRPPRATWWIKQSLLYFFGLVLMKLCVLFLFAVLPWIVWVGDWALRWTEGNETVQIAFVMFIFPLVMNAAQYYVIDAFIKEPGQVEEDAAGPGGEDDADARAPLRGDGAEDGGEEDGEDDDDDDNEVAAAVFEDEAKAPSKPTVTSLRDVDDNGGSSGSSPGDFDTRNTRAG